MIRKLGILCLSFMMIAGLVACGTPQGTDAEAVRRAEGASSETTGTTPGERAAGDAGMFDLEKGMVLLNSGYGMPILGIGCFRLSQSQAEDSVYWALRDGYRLIDTARIYGNEEGVGHGIQRAIDASLSRLNLEYIDLMILHHSQPSNDVEAYQAMERAVEAGKLKSVGLSNYYEPEDFDRLVDAATIMPALLQNETHPYHQSTVMKEHIAQYGTVMESWFPLGGRGNTQVLFDDETISSIATEHGKTSAQVILRWHTQMGFVVIPGSKNVNHIKENLDILDFQLTDTEMAEIAGLDKNVRYYHRTDEQLAQFAGRRPDFEKK